MTKEEFTQLYNKEMKELSRVESAINELGFSMNGVVDKHKNCLWEFERYARNHQSENNNGLVKKLQGMVRKYFFIRKYWL